MTPHSFKAKHVGQCADGWVDCGGIKVGDIVVRLPHPALFDIPRYSRASRNHMYYKLSFSHLECYEKAETERLQREKEREAREDHENRK